MEKKIKVGDKEIEIKTLTYLEGIEIQDIMEKDKKEAAKRILNLSTNLNEEEISKLSLQEGLEIQKVVNEINNFQDFQQTTKE